MCSVTLFPDGHPLLIQRVVQEESQLTIHLQSQAETACCPVCQSQSSRIHSRYQRSPMDLPCFGIKTQLAIQVRRFVCVNQECPRTIFAERLDELIQPYARTTNRLAGTQRQLALALGGEPGCRLAALLGMPSSADTLLRRIQAYPSPDCAGVRVLGVDDWAFRRGQRYGTILCDLETHQVVDLLPDRTSESLATWLEVHSGVEIISRDRAGAYARGAAQGAPQAIQVADRWHLLKNAREVLQKVVDRHQAKVRQAIQVLAGQQNAEIENLAGDAEPTVKSTNSPPQETASRERRKACYEQVVQLHQQGVSQREIASLLQLGRRTIRRYLRADGFPERATRKHSSRLDPYLETLKQLWDQGTRKATSLWKQLKTLGFAGSYDVVRREVARWRDPTPTEVHSPQELQSGSASAIPSSRRISWLLWRKAEELDEEEQKLITELKQTAEILQASQQIDGFRTLICERQIGDWESWLQQACSVESPKDVRNFGKSLKQDESAVKAAIELEWSNGQVEGQVNRLKTIKRQMYGRAGFRLLKARLLNRA